MAQRFGPVGDPLEYDSRLKVARRRGGLERNGGTRAGRNGSDEGSAKEERGSSYRGGRRRSPIHQPSSTQNRATPQGGRVPRHPHDLREAREISFCQSAGGVRGTLRASTYGAALYESSRTRHSSYQRLPGYPHPTGWTPPRPRDILWTGESKFLLR